MDFNSEFDPSSSSSGGRQSLKHPTVTFFHLLFRSLALAVYLFGGIFSASFIGVFVAVVLLLSLDFWTVKNVSGRILVGLRWWNYIDEEGKSQWMFEARNGNSQHLLSAAEIRIFWTSLVLAPAMWTVFFLTALFSFKFQWLVLVIIGLTLSSTNMLGYLRCRLGHTESLTSSVSKMANAYMQKQMFSNVMGLFSGKKATAGGGVGESSGSGAAGII